MAHEMITLQESPLETERLLAAAAFSNTIDMSGFEAAYNAPNTQIPGFNSLVEEPEMTTTPGFNSLLEDGVAFNSFL